MITVKPFIDSYRLTSRSRLWTSLEIKARPKNAKTYPNPRGFLLFFIGKFCDANPFLYFFLLARSGESAESLWSRPLGTSLSCHQLLTVVSDWRIFLIAPRVIWLDLWTNWKSDPPLRLVKRKWNLWQLSSAEPARKVRFSTILTRGFLFRLDLALRSALRVAHFQIKKIISKERLWDQGRF